MKADSFAVIPTASLSLYQSFSQVWKSRQGKVMTKMKFTLKACCLHLLLIHLWVAHKSHQVEEFLKLAGTGGSHELLFECIET